MTVGDLARIASQGRLRAAINVSNMALVQQVDGDLAGVSPALAQRLADELGLPIEHVIYESAGTVFADAGNDIWDVAFLAVDKSRARVVAFTRPYVIIESTYAVRAASAFTDIGEADQAGLKLLVGRASAYDLYLTHAIERAELVRAESPGASMQRFRAGEGDMVAGVRQSLEAEFGGDPDYRILPGRFKTIEQAMVLPYHDAALQSALDAFVGRAIADGFVRRALDESGQSALQVA